MAESKQRRKPKPSPAAKTPAGEPLPLLEYLDLINEVQAEPLPLQASDDSFWRALALEVQTDG